MPAQMANTDPAPGTGTNSATAVAAPSAAPKVEGSPTAALSEESAGYPPKPPRDEDSPPTSVAVGDGNNNGSPSPTTI